MRVVVLGAGFGGLEIAARLSEALGGTPDQVDVTLVDSGEGFVFGFSKLDVLMGRTDLGQVLHRYADLALPGVRFVAARVTSIDPIGRVVTTDSTDAAAQTLVGDVLVVALGADLDPAATPGLLQGGHEFYTVAGAVRAGDALAAFEGGRVVVGVTATPFKCPPAPSETALLVHDYLVARGLRDASSVDLVMPLPAPIPPSPQASSALLAAFAERDIGWHPNRLVVALDPERRTARLADGDEIPYDLFLGVPRHHAPAVVVAAGLAVDGWIPVDPETLETSVPGVYAVGDVTSVGTPKAGVFAEGQAAVVADGLIARALGREPSSTYDGRGICYLEFGHDAVARVDVTFRAGERPVGDLEGPSAALVRDKQAFGRDRIARWFGREWSPI